MRLLLTLSGVVLSLCCLIPPLCAQELPPARVNDVPVDVVIPEPAGGDLRILETDWAVIAGKDFASVGAVKDMTEAAAVLGRHYFNTPSRFLQSMTIELVEPFSSRPGRPFFKSDGLGSLTVVIPWTEKTTFRATCRILAESMTARTLMSHYKTQEPVPVPAWLAQAMGLELELALRPSAIHQFARVGRESALVSLATLLEAGNESFPEQAFWLFRVLESKTDDRVEFQRFLAELLRSSDSFAVLTRYFRGAFRNRRDAELWWAVQYNHICRDRQTAVRTLEESRQWLQRMVWFDLDRAGDGSRLTGVDLWKARGDSQLQSMTTQRLREIKADVVTVNPVYSNASLTLGLAFEALQGTDETAFLEAWEHFQRDFEAGDALNADIRLSISRESIQ